MVAEVGRVDRLDETGQRVEVLRVHLTGGADRHLEAARHEGEQLPHLTQYPVVALTAEKKMFGDELEPVDVVVVGNDLVVQLGPETEAGSEGRDCGKGTHRYRL